MQVVHEKNSVATQVTIPDATNDTKNLDVLVQEDVAILFNKDTHALENSSENGSSKNRIKPEIVLNDDLKAPITKNSVIGKISYIIDGKTYSTDLIAGNSVIASGAFSILVRIILILVTVYLLYLLLKTPKNKHGSSKKKRKKKSKNCKKGSGSFRFTSLNNLRVE